MVDNVRQKSGFSGPYPIRMKVKSGFWMSTVTLSDLSSNHFGRKFVTRKHTHKINGTADIFFLRLPYMDPNGIFILKNPAKRHCHPKTKRFRRERDTNQGNTAIFLKNWWFTKVWVDDVGRLGAFADTSSANMNHLENLKVGHLSKLRLPVGFPKISLPQRKNKHLLKWADLCWDYKDSSCIRVPITYENHGSQPQCKACWFILDDDKSLYSKIGGS